MVLFQLKNYYLQSHKVEYLSEVQEQNDTENESVSEKCRVQIQREVGIDGLLRDEACGEEAPKGYARFCK